MTSSAPNAGNLRSQDFVVQDQPRTKFIPRKVDDNSVRGTALVTGAGRRLGLAIAVHLARLGFDIAIHYNESADGAAQCAGDVVGEGRKCQLFQADLSKSAQAETLVESVAGAMPPLTLIVNSASVWKPVSFVESSTAELLENLSVHLVAPYLLIRDFARLGQRGQVINILDSAISSNRTQFFPYLLSKRALAELTTMSAAELAPGIRVNAVAPGTVLPTVGEAAAVFTVTPQCNPLKHHGSPEDVLKAIDFLVNSPHVTGQCLFVGGGDHL
ncbi:MAG: SDR family NAD(P)-dependent oxidoreductase [Candidatus Obscuribacterales bacterium]|nr:SDR family NAD(P)-dependent oxidoreductase [Candidatus Obscuribacterales bacterium]